MIVAIPVEENTSNKEVCPSFGRSPMYLLYDSEAGTMNFLDNQAALASGGAGIKAAQFLVDSKVDAVITPRCGQNAAEVLKGSGVKIYKTTRGSVKENLDCYMKGMLSPLNNFHAGFHGHGGQA